MKTFDPAFRTAVETWLVKDPRVDAAVLYGSGARAPETAGGPDRWSDLDLHVIAAQPAAIERTEWNAVLPGQPFCLQAVRSASGGARKITVVFTTGEMEIVLLPRRQLQLGRLAWRCGLHRRLRGLRQGLNPMATALRSGYRFIKGEAAWGRFYAGVVAEMPGIRLSDEEARAQADLFLCNLLTAFQRLARGELAAAQLALHRTLAETNFVLVREWQLRRGRTVTSFEVARRVETMLPPEELAWVTVDARLDAAELRAALTRALDGLMALMTCLVPAWRVPAGFQELLAPHLAPRATP